STDTKLYRSSRGVQSFRFRSVLAGTARKERRTLLAFRSEPTADAKTGRAPARCHRRLRVVRPVAGGGTAKPLHTAWAARAFGGTSSWSCRRRARSARPGLTAVQAARRPASPPDRHAPM